MMVGISGFFEARANPPWALLRQTWSCSCQHLQTPCSKIALWMLKLATAYDNQLPNAFSLPKCNSVCTSLFLVWTKSDLSTLQWCYPLVCLLGLRHHRGILAHGHQWQDVHTSLGKTARIFDLCPQGRKGQPHPQDRQVFHQGPKLEQKHLPKNPLERIALSSHSEFPPLWNLAMDLLAILLYIFFGHNLQLGQLSELYMGVSKNGGIPKWMVYNGKPC